MEKKEETDKKHQSIHFYHLFWIFKLNGENLLENILHYLLLPKTF
jgi:hypothetical protein